MITAIFDCVLVALLLWLGWRSVSDRDLFRAAINFIALGLIMAITWFRLSAPDLALAEAAVGSGLTGALLLVALRRWRDRDSGRGGRQ
jgi:uncharacterized MnhB-related membrane protein